MADFALVKSSQDLLPGGHIGTRCMEQGQNNSNIGASFKGIVVWCSSVCSSGVVAPRGLSVRVRRKVPYYSLSLFV